MNYEKAYKEALEKARQFSEHPLQEDSSSIVEYIFPELAESEDDKIRKALIRFHKSTIDVDGIKGEDIIAWLEKQGEQKSADEVLKIRQEVYQSGYNDGYKHGIEDVKQGEQKSVEWSEEDDKVYYSIWGDIRTRQEESTSTLEAHYNEQVDWLNSLKQRIKGE